MKTSINILVVDDEAPVRFMVMKFLTKFGYRVNEAFDGYQAKEIVLDAVRIGNPVDLMILDLEMPRMNGIELLKYLSQEQSCPPILLLTGSTNPSQDQILKDDHCLGIVRKPFTREELKDKVAYALSVLSGHGCRQ